MCFEISRRVPRSTAHSSMRTLASRMKRAGDKLRRTRRYPILHLVDAETKELSSSADGDDLLFEGLTNESVSSVAEKLGPGEAHRLVLRTQRLARGVFVLERKAPEDVFVVGKRAIEHCLPTHLEDALHLEDSIDEGQAARILPFSVEHGLRHQEVTRENVRFVLLCLVLGRSIDIVRAQVKEEVSELMGGREDPTLDRNAVPDVDDDGWPTLLAGNGQSEELCGGELERIDLYAVVFEKAADVANPLLRHQAQRLPGLQGSVLRPLRSLINLLELLR